MDDEFARTLDLEIQRIANDNPTIKFLIAALTFYKQKYKNATESTIDNIKSIIISLSDNPTAYDDSINSITPITIDVKSIVGGSSEQFESLLTKLRSEQNESVKSFYESLRHKIALYKNLREHSYEFTNANNLDGFVKLANIVLDVDSEIKTVNESNFKNESDKLNKSVLHKLILKRTIELYFHFMEHKLNFEMTEQYSNVILFNNYCTLKSFATVNNIKFDV